MTDEQRSLLGFAGEFAAYHYLRRAAPGFADEHWVSSLGRRYLGLALHESMTTVRTSICPDRVFSSMRSRRTLAIQVTWTSGPHRWRGRPSSPTIATDAGGSSTADPCQQPRPGGGPRTRYAPSQRAAQAILSARRGVRASGSTWTERPRQRVPEKAGFGSFSCAVQGRDWGVDQGSAYGTKRHQPLVGLADSASTVRRKMWGKMG